MHANNVVITYVNYNNLETIDIIDIQSANSRYYQ